MQIHQLSSPIANRYNKTKNIAPVFKGKADFNDDSKIPYEKVDMRAFLNNPMIILYRQLLQDGFTVNEIEKNCIFQTYSANSDTNATDSGSNCEHLSGCGNESKFQHVEKTLNDVKSMLRVYRQLKKNITVDDANNHSEKLRELENKTNALFGKIPFDKDEFTRKLKLRILYCTNKFNEPLVYKLLNDKNFDNYHIGNALINVTDKSSANVANEVINFAQQIGYDKKFSFPLSIMIVRSNQANLELIKRLIQYEQDFLINNLGFTAFELIDFLRFKNPLLQKYLNDPEMSLQTIYDLMQSSFDDIDFD